MKDEILAIFKSALIEFKLDSNKVKLNSKVTELGIDSLDLMYIVINVEKKYDIFFEEEELRSFTYVKDFIKMCEKKFNEKNK